LDLGHANAQDVMVNLVRQIVALSKLRIVSLLVFVAACGMWKAAEGTPTVPVLLAVLLGGALAAAGSNSINQGLDSDIDAAMQRTRGRPVPSDQISRRAALILGAAAIGIATVAMGLLANWLSASLTLGAAAIYVFIYTMFMKRRSWNNIVIGGAAGALPPLIGAAAVSGVVDAAGLYMFALVFFWTPPHFWALSLMLKEEYAAVRVPMLPVVMGDRNAAVQIVLYIFLLIVLAWLPVAGGFAGLVYAGTASLLGIEWLRRSLPLLHDGSRAKALTSYKFSLLYLFGIFLVLAVEPLLPWA
jgi:protoheme IX farnesyltransferase